MAICFTLDGGEAVDEGDRVVSVCVALALPAHAPGRLAARGRTSNEGEEVWFMLSARMKLALLAVASVVGAALVGGLPWGP